KQDTDPEVAWALAAQLRPAESISVRQHISKYASELNPSDAAGWNQRLFQFTTTMVNPRHWPDAVWQESSKSHLRPTQEYRSHSSTSRHGESKYILNGETITYDQVKRQCDDSFAALVNTIECLRKENEHAPDYLLLRDTLPQHIERAGSLDELDAIARFLN